MGMVMREGREETSEQCREEMLWEEAINELGKGERVNAEWGLKGQEGIEWYGGGEVRDGRVRE